MRYRLALLLLLAVLPLMNVWAAPAPAPSAILDVGLPPKGEAADAYRKRQAGYLSHPHGFVNEACCDPEVNKAPSVARLKDARPWVAKNLQITEEEGGRHLRLTFRAGSREEQVAIINALLRVYVRRMAKENIKRLEEGLRKGEADIREREQLIASGRQPEMVETFRKDIDYLRSVGNPECRAEIARLKQIKVIKWAK